MAEPGGTIDPNDLDSIDALLDEAELEAAEEEEPAAEDLAESDLDTNAGSDRNNAIDNSEELDDIPEAPEAEDEPDIEEPSSEDFDDVVADDDNAVDEDFDFDDKPEADESIQKAEPEAAESVQDAAPVATNIDIEKSAIEDRAEDFLKKRTSIKKSEPSNLTVAEMDSIKKLIIIFSSTLIFLVVTAIGISLWGALSSGTSLDEETMSLIKDTHEGAMQSMVKSSSAEDAVKQVGKKLDALSFQLEQLNTDLLQMKEIVTVAPDNSKTPLAVLDLKNEQGKQGVVEPKQNAIASNAQVVVDSGVAKKIDKVNAQVVVTQRRLAEVNNRVKTLQNQYQTFLKSLKELEKSQLKGQSNITDLLEATKAQTEADKIKRQAMEKSRYEYSAPNSPFFDYVR